MLLHHNAHEKKFRHSYNLFFDLTVKGNCYLFISKLLEFSVLA